MCTYMICTYIRGQPHKFTQKHSCKYRPPNPVPLSGSSGWRSVSRKCIHIHDMDLCSSWPPDPQFSQLLAPGQEGPGDSSPNPSAGTETYTHKAQMYKAALPSAAHLICVSWNSSLAWGEKEATVSIATYMVPLLSLCRPALCNVKIPRDRCESISTSLVGTHGKVACNKYSEQAVGSESLLEIEGTQKGNKAQIQIKDAPYR